MGVGRGYSGDSIKAAGETSAALASLHDVALAAGRRSDSRQLADLVVDRARRLARGDGAVLRWFDPARQAFKLLASAGVAPGVLAEIAAAENTAIAAAFKDGRPVIVNDYEASGQTTSWGRRQGIRAQVAIPLLVDGNPIGTLAVLSFSDHTYDQRDALTLSLLAAIVAPAIEAARLAKEVRKLAHSTAQIYESLPVMVVVFDRDGRPIHHNSTALAALGADVLDGVRDRTLPLYREDLSLIPDDERPSSIALRTKAPVRGTVAGFGTGDLRWVYIDAVPLLDDQGEVEAVVTSSIDVTSLRAAEARRREDASRLRRLIEVQAELSDPQLTAKAVIERVAERAVELTGAPGAEVQILDGDFIVIEAGVGLGCERLGGRFPVQGNPLNGCLAEGGTESTSDASVDPRCDRSNARANGIRSLVTAPIAHEGRIIGALQVHSAEPDAFADRDDRTIELLAGFAGASISRARAAAAVREGEQLLSGAFQASGIGMALTGLDGSLVRANPALCQMLGYTEPDLVGMNTRQLVAPDDLNRVVSTLEGLYTRSDPSVSSTNARVLHRDGRRIVAQITASLIRLDGEPRFVLVHVVDVTEERRAEAIIRAEKDRLSEIVDAQRDIASSELDLDRLLAVFAERTVRLAGGGAVAVLLPEGEQLVVRAAAGTPAIPLGYALPIGGSLAGSAFRSATMQRTADARSDPRAHAPTASRSGVRSMIATPLLHGSRVMGVLQLVSEQPGTLDEIDVRTLQMVAGFAAAAYERASGAARLQASERRTRAVIESAPYPIVLFETDTGAIVEFNPAAEQGFGWSREDAVGRPATMLLPNRRVEAFSRWLSDGHKAGTQTYAGSSFETTGRRADGGEFPIEVAIADLPEDTRLAGAFIRDVSLRHRLRESRERLASVVAGTPVILLACDMAGIITLSEGKGLAAFGLTPVDTTGRSLRELLADEPDALGHLDRALRGDSFSGLIHLAGPDVFLEATYGPIKDGEDTMTGVSAMLTDVSDRIHAEAARHESDAKSRLMAMMNHEVRTPLNSILGFATLLAESRAGALNEQQRHYIANIDSAGRQLLELVNESLDLAKLKAGHVPVQLREVSAQQVIESAAGQVQPIAAAAGVSLLVEPAPGVVVRADPAQLVQVLLNLLSNAIRHTPAGGRVTMSASNQADRVAIRVADNGQGIGREDVAHIFEEFYQARNHAPGGTGLGLTISRRLVEQMRGSIEVESELGVGSTFTVTLGRGRAGQS